MRDKPVMIWLDDERDPSDQTWRDCFPIESPVVVWLRSFDAFASWIDDNGLPDAISFDHDLGSDLSGMDAARYVVDYCLDHNATLPAWGVHSANPVGSDNIKALLASFQRHQESN